MTQELMMFWQRGVLLQTRTALHIKCSNSRRSAPTNCLVLITPLRVGFPFLRDGKRKMQGEKEEGKEKKGDKAIHVLRLIISPNTKPHCRLVNCCLNVSKHQGEEGRAGNLKSDKSPQRFHVTASPVISLLIDVQPVFINVCF